MIIPVLGGFLSFSRTSNFCFLKIFEIKEPARFNYLKFWTSSVPNRVGYLMVREQAVIWQCSLIERIWQTTIMKRFFNDFEEVFCQFVDSNLADK
jgi:hypothetical protein